mmetsp:Transcript_17295/g.48728  ORF Transcript_17295/g.48728 Transcript_17295/m.48728 type:complete len:264 (-) Transcript_17295:2773-3564(-)
MEIRQKWLYRLHLQRRSKTHHNHQRQQRRRRKQHQNPSRHCSTLERPQGPKCASWNNHSCRPLQALLLSRMLAPTAMIARARTRIVTATATRMASPTLHHRNRYRNQLLSCSRSRSCNRNFSESSRRPACSGDYRTSRMAKLHSRRRRTSTGSTTHRLPCPPLASLKIPPHRRKMIPVQWTMLDASTSATATTRMEPVIKREPSTRRCIPSPRCSRRHPALRFPQTCAASLRWSCSHPRPAKIGASTIASPALLCCSTPQVPH